MGELEVEMEISRLNLTAFILALSLALCSCGGGGTGGSKGGGAAKLKLQVDPRIIDTGDIMGVNVKISEISPSGIALKIRYPIGLVYVADSSFIEVGGNIYDIGPDFEEADSTHVYLVFFLSRDDLVGRDEGIVGLTLVGEAAIEDGLLEIDADLDDQLIDNDVEFDIQNPAFTAQRKAGVKVKN